MPIASSLWPRLAAVSCISALLLGGATMSQAPAAGAEKGMSARATDHAVPRRAEAHRSSGSQVPVFTAQVLSQTAGASRDPFGRLVGMATGPGGSVFVVTRLPVELHHFARGGKLLRTVGRDGDGPGELRSPCCPRMSADSVLWVVGLGGQLDRFSIKGGELRFLSRIKPRGGPYAFFGVEAPAFLSNRRVRMSATTIPRRNLFLPVILELDSTGTVSKVIEPHQPPPDSMGRVTFRLPNGELVSERWIPFGPRYLLRMAKDGSFIRIITSEYMVLHYNPDGTLRREIRGNATADPLTPSERKTVADHAAEMRRISTQTGSRIVSLLQPREKPVISDAWFDDTNRLWVQTDTAGPAVRIADVYSDKGDLVFRARWSADIELRYGAISGMFAWGVRRNDMDEQSLVELQFR